ncbi:MAG: hypothetical protein RIE52_12000 [Balneola sp.]
MTRLEELRKRAKRHHDIYANVSWYQFSELDLIEFESQVRKEERERIQKNLLSNQKEIINSPIRFKGVDIKHINQITKVGSPF